MNRAEALKGVSTLVENDLLTTLKLIKEGSYGILSNVAKEREVKRFKTRIDKRYYEALSTEEINVIIEYILIKNGINVNEQEITESKPKDLDER